MKELTIKQKAQRYDEGLERAKKLQKTCDSTAVIGWCEYIFPELKESKDERIKREIIEYIKTGTYHKDWLAWLEKQGEQKPPIIDFKAKNWYVSPVDGKIHDMTYNPINNEPKFKVGDWIYSDNTNENYCICKIIKIEDDKYYIESVYGFKGYNTFEIFEKDYHKWTINDTKDGDVLASKYGDNILIFRNLDTNTSFSSYYNIAGKGELGWSNSSFIPATKEQRDTLFKAMTDAGYEFDFEKKELKKIEQTPTWSEEDEKMLINFIHLCDEEKLKFSDTSPMCHGIVLMQDWLKSLKERITNK